MESSEDFKKKTHKKHCSALTTEILYLYNKTITYHNVKAEF